VISTARVAGRVDASRGLSCEPRTRSAPGRTVGLARSYKILYSQDMAEKPLLFVGGSRDDLRRFPADARRRAGFELDQVQNGELPSNWKPMTEVGAGVIEIRIHTETEHRVFYVAKFQEAIYVLHAFEKKSQKTP
jgi:phage-related protein